MGAPGLVKKGDVRRSDKLSTMHEEYTEDCRKGSADEQPAATAVVGAVMARSTQMAARRRENSIFAFILFSSMLYSLVTPQTTL